MVVDTFYNEFLIKFLEETDLLFYGELEEIFPRLLNEMINYTTEYSLVKDRLDYITESEYWFMVSILNATDIVEYGSSPRGYWLTKKGEKLKELFHLIDNTEKLRKYTSEYYQ
jgi:hypothetical protein